MARPILFFLLLLLLPTVHAVGFMSLPAQREHIFEPGLEFDVPIIVTNDGNIHVTLTTITPADPATLGTPDDNNILEYVELIDEAPDTGSRQVIMRFKLPQQLRPGIYGVDLVAKDIPGDQSAAVTAIAATKVRITIRALSPDKLIEITGVSVPPIAEGLDANTTVSFTSRTTQDISIVYAQAAVYKDGVQIAEGISPRISLPTAESGSLTVPLITSSLAGGEYTVRTSLTYDQITIQGPDEILKVGTLHVAVPEHTTGFTYNTTNRFLFNISNQWNRELQDVYATVRIGGQVKKTASQDIAPFGKTEYESYFDREESLLPGIQAVNITVSYKDFDPRTKTYVAKEESFASQVTVNTPPAPAPGLSGAMIALYGFIGLLLLLLIIATVLLLRHKNPPAAPPAPPASPPVNP